MGPISNALGNVDLSTFISALQQGGWFDIVFPFLLIYAIVFTILNKVEIFKDNKSVKVIIAIVVAFFSVSFPINGNFASCNIGVYSTGCETLGSLMMTLFPGVSAFSLGILALYIIMAMLGVDLTEFFGPNDENNMYIRYILGGIGLLIVIYYYALGFGWSGFNGNNFLVNLLTDPFLYIIVIFGFVFFFISSEPKNKNNNNSQNNKEV